MRADPNGSVVKFTNRGNRKEQGVSVGYAATERRRLPNGQHHIRQVRRGLVERVLLSSLTSVSRREEDMRDSAVIALVVVLVNLGVHVLLGTLLRRDIVAQIKEKPSDHDRGTSGLMRVAFAVSWLVLLLTAPLNQFQIGIIEPHLIFIAIGVVLMAASVALRVVAMRTLGRFFTVTLQIREGHHVVSDGIYRRIRHPGYLADIILFVGSGIATSNVITTVVILGVILPAFVRRIAAEERMLTDQLGKEYSDYKARTWKLIPFVC
jgi:protein-S-isoprenylcysteine O-methyltransferase Ste14